MRLLNLLISRSLEDLFGTKFLELYDVYTHTQLR